MKKISMLFTCLAASMVASVAHSDEFESPNFRPWKPQQPWKIPKDSSTAMNQPDHYAWQLFVALNWPANTTKCKADKNAQLGANGSTTWFWATFEHIDNERRWPQIYPDAFSGWLTPSIDRTACPESDLSCNQYPEGYGLAGTKW